MDYFTRKRFYKGLILILVLLNISTLAYIIITRNPRPSSSDGQQDLLITELGFEGDQLSQFLDMRKTHHDKVESIMDRIDSNKNAIFEIIHNEGSREEALPYAQKLGQLQVELDMETYDYFLAVHELCNSEQKDKLDDLIEHIRHPVPGKRGPSM